MTQMYQSRYTRWLDSSGRSADVSKQIYEMVRFIRQEAEEKANEISVSAEEEFNIVKLQIVEAEKKKIRGEYERKGKQVEVRKKIEYSMQLNASRIKVLQAQDDVVNAMKDSASKDLLNVSNNKNACKNLLKGLIVQVLNLPLKQYQGFIVWLLYLRKGALQLEQPYESEGENI